MLGLTSEEAKQRAAQGLANVQIDKSAKTKKDILRENILTYFNLIFLILAILLVIAGSYKSLTFLPVIIANTLIGIMQELHAKKVLDELSIMNAVRCDVMRDNETITLPIEELVKGDYIVLHAGNQVPADALIKLGSVRVNEALLTGEADEIEKGPDAMLLSGSFIASGECVAQLTHVGRDSHISRLMLEAKEMSGAEQSEMVRSINRIVIAAGILIIPIGITLFVQGFFFQNHSFSESVTSMVAAVIGMIPEGLYLLVSVTLAISSVRLARRHVMLHDMKSIETLARVNILCVDKTGTITDNSMLVANAVPAAEGSSVSAYHSLMGEYLSALPDDNITMQAMRDYFKPIPSRMPVEIFPFSSQYKYSSVRFDDAVYVLGAPEFVLASNYEQWREKVNSFAGDGLRVLVFARYHGSLLAGRHDMEPSSDDGDPAPPADSGPCLTGAASPVPSVPRYGLASSRVEPLLFILLQNPLRDNAVETFSYFKTQGVKVKVISGDNPITVSEVAKQAGISHADEYIDAQRLKTDKDIEEAAARYTVFGRVMPEQKRKIVTALKKQGNTVAMTGDGVNDILAMKEADCSIAMAAGSDAAVQAAQVVLLDSDFSHMPQIVGEGRRTINNIERSATLFLVKNLFSLMLSVFAIVSMQRYPLQPSQISLISAFNIGIPAFFLAMEPNRKRIGKGRFIPRVLVKAMPAALTDFLAISALIVFGNTFQVSQNDISVASTYLLAIVGFIILFQISKPLNKYRVWVIMGCTAGLAFCAFFFRDLFSMYNVSRECIMLFVLFAIATEPCMRYLTRLFETGRTRFTKMIEKMREEAF